MCNTEGLLELGVTGEGAYFRGSVQASHREPNVETTVRLYEGLLGLNCHGAQAGQSQGSRLLPPDWSGDSGIVRALLGPGNGLSGRAILDSGMESQSINSNRRKEKNLCGAGRPENRCYSPTTGREDVDGPESRPRTPTDSRCIRYGIIVITAQSQVTKATMLSPKTP